MITKLTSHLPTQVLALLVFAGGLAFAADDPAPIRWNYVGPGAYGACWGLAFQPTDPRTIMAGLDMGAAFLTHNGGQHWSIVGTMGQQPPAQPAYRGAWGIAFDPVDPRIIWIASEHGASKSTDGGQTWKMVFGGRPNSYCAIAIDPTDHDVVYIGAGRSVRLGVPWTDGAIQKTTDGGATWQIQRPGGPVDQDPFPARNWSRIRIDPASEVVPGHGHQRVYAAGQGGFYVSEDGGGTWSCLETNLPGGAVDLRRPNDYGHRPSYTSGICDLSLVPGKPRSVLFATIQVRPIPTKPGWLGGVYRSDDGGQTWTERNNGLAPTLAYMATEDFHKTQGLAFGYSLIAATPADPQRLYFGCQGALFRSTDQGEHWTKTTIANDVWVDVPTPDGQTMHPHVRRAGGNYRNASWGCITGLNGLAISPSDPQVVAYTDNSGVGLSTDGGQTWDETTFQFGQPFRTLAPLQDKHGADIQFAPQRLTHFTQNKGIQLVVPESVAVDPFDSQTWAVAYDDIGLEITRDGGRNWEWAWDGIYPDAEQNNALTVIYDPTVKDRLFVATSRRGAGKLYQSDDGGRSFRVIGIEPLRQFAQGHVNEILLDPASPAAARTLYVATTAGLFQTTDGGQHWRALPRNGPRAVAAADFGNMGHLAIDPRDSHVLWAGTHPYASQPLKGLFQTRDAGQTWTQIAPDKFAGIRSLSICQHHPDVMVVVANAPGTSGTWAMATAWKSADAGQTWQRLSNRRCSCAAVHPTNPDIIYIGTWAQDVMTEPVGLYRTDNGGKSWHEADHGTAFTLGFLSNDRICFDPTDPHRLFLLASNGLLLGMANVEPQ